MASALSPATLPNQADNLLSSLTIDQVPILKGKENFNDWSMYIELALD